MKIAGRCRSSGIGRHVSRKNTRKSRLVRLPGSARRKLRRRRCSARKYGRQRPRLTRKKTNASSKRWGCARSATRFMPRKATAATPSTPSVRTKVPVEMPSTPCPAVFPQVQTPSEAPLSEPKGPDTERAVRPPRVTTSARGTARKSTASPGDTVTRERKTPPPVELLRLSLRRQPVLPPTDGPRSQLLAQTSLAMYRAQLAAERRLEQANLVGVQERKTASDGGCESTPWSPSNSPSRRVGKGGSGRRFQRRLEEASAEVSAEAAASPQIVHAAGAARRGTKHPQKADRSDKVPASSGASTGKLSGDCGEGRGHRRRWTTGEDRRLGRLVRELEFDFDLVAARFSSATAGDACGGGMVTAEQCRLRFAHLELEEDASGIGDVFRDDGDTAEFGNLDVCPAIAPAPGVLENAGLSFADLERKARNTKSRFLQPPKELPSTTYGGGDDNHLEDPDHDESDGLASE
ncbi:unnamed protein product, partial [Scytosiphon promiscuus]